MTGLLTRLLLVLVGAIFHKRHGAPYRSENSIRGIRRAARATRRVLRRVGGRLRRIRVRRWGEIDLDLNMTKDGVVVNTHWLRPLLHDKFRDPHHELPLHITVPEMTWEQVARLESPDHYRINTVDTVLHECARDGIGARLEPKADPRFEDPDVWRRVKAAADRYGCRVRGYSIRNLGGKGAGVRRVAAMNAAGIRSNVIR